MCPLVVEHQPTEPGKITALERPAVEADAEAVDEHEGELGVGSADDLDMQRDAVGGNHRGGTSPDRRNGLLRRHAGPVGPDSHPPPFRRRTDCDRRGKARKARPPRPRPGDSAARAPEALPGTE